MVSGQLTFRTRGFLGPLHSRFQTPRSLLIPTHAGVGCRHASVCNVPYQEMVSSPRPCISCLVRKAETKEP